MAEEEKKRRRKGRRVGKRFIGELNSGRLVVVNILNSVFLECELERIEQLFSIQREKLM